MTDRHDDATGADISRRHLLAAAGTGIASVSLLSCTQATVGSGSADKDSGPAPTAPFDSLRDYVAAMEAHGAVFRAGRIDQDKYEGTALMYRLVDEYGLFMTPLVIFDQVKIAGRWIDGPVIANVSGHVYAETIFFGLEPAMGSARDTLRRARTYLDNVLAENEGSYPTIPPVELEREAALCKQVTLDSAAIDVTRLPFLQNNPGDSGRFINTASIVTEDPDMGVNYGTYRCEIEGPRKIIIGSGEGQTGYTMFMEARKRGETTAPVALVCGQDPMTWLISGARIPERRGKKPVDELATAGGMRGEALEVVKCDSNNLRVPAHAEMIIEGVVSLDGFEPNGPYGEASGYIGEVYEQAFPMEVTRITHRLNPWFVNDFTGVTRPLIAMPGAALTTFGLQRFIPSVVDYRYSQSIAFISINKTQPGEALEVGKRLAKLIPIFKIVMLVDGDVDLWDDSQLFMAFSTRWQAYPATYIYEDLPAMPLEPSSPAKGRSSKAVIDATRQWPEEGGPEVYPAYSRDLVKAAHPDIFEFVDEKYSRILGGGKG